MSESSIQRAALQLRIDRLSRPGRAAASDGVAMGHAGIDRMLGGGSSGIIVSIRMDCGR